MKFIDNPIVPFLLFLFYMFHQLVMPEETPLQTVSIFAFLLYALVAAVKLHQVRNTFIYWIDIFLLIQLLYFAVAFPTFSSGNVHFMSVAVNQIKSVLVVMMPIYTYFWYGVRGKLTKTHIIWFSIVFIGLSIPQFYYLANWLMEHHSWINEYNETTNNTAYYFLQGFIFLPLLTTKNRKLSLGVLLIIVFYLLLGVKRGALLCFVFALPFYLKHYFSKTRFYTIPLIVLLVFLASNWFIDYFSDMTYMQTRIEETMEGNSSTRDIIYGKILNYVFDSHFSIFGLLFGYGFNESVNIAGNLAHNDWLELLSGFGLFSVFVYLNIMIGVSRFRKNTIDNDIKACLTMGLVIWFLQTFFSMAYASTSFQFIVIYGLCGISMYEKKRKQLMSQEIVLKK